MELFSKRTDDAVANLSGSNPKKLAQATAKATIPDSIKDDELKVSHVNSFAQLGLCDWICSSTAAVGYRQPTDIQAAVIPAILQGKDVLACAETGSGKTAAFVLPMLQILSQDPYGIFSVVLTPTRELALQISEQISALGASLPSLTIALVIGGMNMTEQSLQLSRRPHFLIATPGRLRHHLEAAEPPNLSKARYLVLDEADRLLSLGFSSELQIILQKMCHPRRQTLLFSATLTATLEELESLALKDALRFDLTASRRIPSTLLQQYLFMPPKIKICFLILALSQFLADAEKASRRDDDDDADRSDAETIVERITRTAREGRDGKTQDSARQKGQEINKKNKKKYFRDKDLDLEIPKAGRLKSLVMIFVESCHRCHEIGEILNSLGVSCVALHSILPQSARLAALNKFKNFSVQILVATDVASRGLDIPAVDLVINYDLPRLGADYVHRVGRTARAGRGGHALSFVTQHDISLLQSIEEQLEHKLTLYEKVKAEQVPPLLNPISKAIQAVHLNILTSDFAEKEEVFKKRKQKQRKQLMMKKKSRVDEDD